MGRQAKSPHSRFTVPHELEISWRSLPLSAAESEFNFVNHVRRMQNVKASKYGSGIDNATPRTMKYPPPFVRTARMRPASAGAPAASKGIFQIEPCRSVRATQIKSNRKSGKSNGPLIVHEPNSPGIAQAKYKLNEEQGKIYAQFTSLLAEFDSFIMGSILEDARRDAKRKTLLGEYSSPMTL